MSGTRERDHGYYDQSIGRFISLDTIVPGVGDPRAWSRHAYVRNNPLRYTDPRGHCIIRDDDEFETILTTKSDDFDCEPHEVWAFDWSLMQY